MAPNWHDLMTQLSLASNQPEARKFSRDDEVRPGTPEPEVFRPRAPALSRSWGLISIVVAHRNADVARDHHRAIDSKWRYDEGDSCSEARRYPSLLAGEEDPELVIGRRVATAVGSARIASISGLSANTHDACLWAPVRCQCGMAVNTKFREILDLLKASSLFNL